MILQFFRFVIVGGIGFVVDAGLVLFLSSHGLSPIAARIPAIGAAMCVTWLLNRYLTFRVAVRKSAAEAGRYMAVALVSAALNFLLYSALVVAGIWPGLAVAIATAALMLFSFFAYKRFAFSQTN